VRTYADRQQDVGQGRYALSSDTRDIDPSTKEGATAILSVAGAKKAAKIALDQLWKQAQEPGQGYLPTARISAPLRVLLALETLGLIEKATDDRGRAYRYRLSLEGLRQAKKKAGLIA